MKTLGSRHVQACLICGYFSLILSAATCASVATAGVSDNQEVEYRIGVKPNDSCVMIAMVNAEATRLKLSDASTFTKETCISQLRKKSKYLKANFLNIRNLEREGESYNYFCSGIAYSC